MQGLAEELYMPCKNMEIYDEYIERIEDINSTLCAVVILTVNIVVEWWHKL